MENFWTFVLAVILIAVLFLLPMTIILALSTFALAVFSKMFSPISEPIQSFIESISESVPDPLDMIPSFPGIKRYMGSTKNILFILFVIIFLLWHFISHIHLLGNAETIMENSSLLFPGSALEQFVASAQNIINGIFGIFSGKFDFSSLLVNPESYLQILIFPLITGLFLHIGCTTKAPDAEINIFVKLAYTLLISLFSAIVVGMIPADLLKFSLPEFSLDLSFAGAAAGDRGFLMVLAELREYFGILLSKLISILPAIVAIYFLSRSISSIAATFLAGMISILFLAILCSNTALGTDSPFAIPALLLLFVGVEVGAMAVSELLNKLAAEIVSEVELFSSYNIISLLLAYFFYPALPVSILCFISQLINGFDIAVLGLGLACLAVFSLVTFVGYKLTNLTLNDEVDGTGYTAAMVVNVPIWILYIILFAF